MQPALFGNTWVKPSEPLIDGDVPRGVRLGTSTWSFPGWAHHVYDRAAPADALAREGLQAYARHPALRTVSIDRGYYGPVPVGTLKDLAAQTPDDFSFVVKALDRLCIPRFPDHPRYGELRRGQVNPRFLDADYAPEVVAPYLEGLGSKLGVVLFQLPPQAPDPREFVRKLDHCLAALPSGPVYAIEVRNPALLTPAYADVLASHGAVHCLTVHPRMPNLRTQWKQAGIARQAALMVRWNLHDGAYADASARLAPFDRLQEPDPTRREQIAKACLWAEAKGRPAWVIVNNLAEGCAPASIRLLLESVRNLR